MNKRQFLLGSAAGLIGLGADVAPWHALGAFAREVEDFVRGPAVKDHPLSQLSEHVWQIFSPDGFPTPENQGMMCNVTIVDTRKGLVVVDTGASVQIGEMTLRQLARQFDKPVVALINTHYHGDHWLGNHAYVDAYGEALPIYAHAGTISAVRGIQGSSWHALMERWTNQATAGTRIVPPNRAVKDGDVLDFADVTLRLHHYGVVHTPNDICVEVLPDKLMLVGDVAMNRRIANMDDGSYVNTLKTYGALEATGARLWVPGHGPASAEVLEWNRQLFEGIYQTCRQALDQGKSLEEAKPLVLRDARVASRAAETKGFESNIGKYVSLAYLEAEREAF